MTGTVLTSAPDSSQLPRVEPSQRWAPAVMPSRQAWGALPESAEPDVIDEVPDAGLPLADDAEPRVPWAGIVFLALGGALLALLSLPFARPLAEAATSWLDTFPHADARDAVDRWGDAGVALLGLLAALAVAFSWRQRGASVPAIAALVAAPLAFLSASLLKGMVHEVRPCTSLGLPNADSCPPLNDYSWPSNHTAVAVSLTLAVIIASSRLWLRLLASAALVLVLATRVASGAHWVHDVASGVALGALVTFVVLAVAHGASVWAAAHARPAED